MLDTLSWNRNVSIYIFTDIWLANHIVLIQKYENIDFDQNFNVLSLYLNKEKGRNDNMNSLKQQKTSFSL